MSKREIRCFSDECLEAFRSSGLPDLLKKDKELFLGIRDNYANIYYGGTSLALWKYNTGKPYIEVHKKYLTGLDSRTEVTKSNYIRFNDVSDYLSIFGDGKKIKQNAYQVYVSGHAEKRVQQNLILKNNKSPDSMWYCTDLEYAQSRYENEIPGFGRFDIIALSRNRIGGKYKLALVELKVDGDAFGSALSEKARDALKDKNFGISKSVCSFGSGILGHFADFYRFMEYGQWKQLIEETCNIVNAKRELADLIGLEKYPYGNDLTPQDIDTEIEYHFVVVCAKADKAKLQESFKRHLLANVPRASKHAVERVFGNACFQKLTGYPIKFHFNEECDDADFLIWPVCRFL